MNNTSSTPGEMMELKSAQENSTLAIVVKMTSCSVVALFSLVGNIIVIFVVFKVKRMQTNTFFLIANMSISDFLYTVIAMPPFMLTILGLDVPLGGFLGWFFCKVFNGAGFGLMACSVLTLTAISCDRFFGIVRPFKKRKIKRYLKGVVALISLSSLLVMSPLLYAMRVGEQENVFFCYEDWSPLFNTIEASRTYTIVLFIVLYLVPFLAMSILYSCAAYVLWFRKVPGNGRKQNKHRAFNGRWKVIRMLITVVLCFILCWLPLQVASFSVYFGDRMLPLEFFFVSDFLIRANGAINPVIYVALNKTFRLQFNRILSQFSLCKRRQQMPL